jgi:hypothetical protein
MKFLSDPSNSTTLKPWAHRGPGVQCAGRDGSIGSTPGIVTSQGTSLFGWNPWDFPVEIGILSGRSMENRWEIMKIFLERTDFSMEFSGLSLERCVSICRF